MVSLYYGARKATDGSHLIFRSHDTIYLMRKIFRQFTGMSRFFDVNNNMKPRIRPRLVASGKLEMPKMLSLVCFLCRPFFETQECLHACDYLWI